MKVLVVSGFLGAGKTTFIKELAEQTHRDFAVMENEYGQVGIDGKLLEDSRETSDQKINIWELTEGCICCSMKSDFASSVLTIANTVDPEFLIVEPTGVGMLGRVIDNLSRIQYDRIEILSPVTILDFHSFDRYYQEFPEIYCDQIASAGSIVLSKTEQADAEELKALKEKLRTINPHANIFEKSYYFEREERLLTFLSRPLDPSKVKAPDTDQPELENLGLTQIALPSPNHLIVFLEGIVAGVFGEICRAKGFLRCGSCILHFETADRMYSVTGMEDTEESRGVFIGKNLNRSLLREALQCELRRPLIQKPHSSRKTTPENNPALFGAFHSDAEKKL